MQSTHTPSIYLESILPLSSHVHLRFWSCLLLSCFQTFLISNIHVLWDVRPCHWSYSPKILKALQPLEMSENIALTQLITDNTNFHKHCCENFKPLISCLHCSWYMFFFIWQTWCYLLKNTITSHMQDFRFYGLLGGMKATRPGDKC